MLQFRCAITLACFFCAWLFSAVVAANSFSVEHFKAIGNDINRNPHPVYQQLLAIEKNKKALTDEAYLWLLYRKAQSENLLYFHQEFAQTVTAARSLITDQTSAEIRAHIGIFNGIVAERSGLYTQAIASYRAAMALAKNENLNYAYTWGKQHLAYSLSLTELYETSLSDLQEAYVEAFAMDDHFLIAVINETYGAVYGYMNEYDKSIEYYNRALDTYERLGYRPFVAEAIYGLASTYRYMKQYDKAIAKFNLYLKRINYTTNRDISYFGAYGLGMTYAEQGNCAKAITTIDNALMLNGQIDYDAELYKQKASCFIKQGNLEKAEENIVRAEQIFAQMPELAGTTWTLENKKIRAALLYAKEQYQQSYTLLKDYHEAYSSLLIKNSTQQLIRVRAAMELERQSVELSLLEQRSRVQSLQQASKEQNTWQQIAFTIGIIMVVALALAIVGLLYLKNKRIYELSITDPLSGVFNRRYVFEYLDKLIATSHGRNGDLAILLFDIDNFKQVNDNYGHPFGDEVIYRVGQIVQDTLRVGDVLGRIGGEEFMCILPRTDAEQAKTIAKRLAANIQQALFTNESGQQITITCSVGISAIDSSKQDRATLYVQSDKALYQAKMNGKNQVVIYQE